MNSLFEKRLRKFNDYIDKKVIQSRNKSGFYKLLNSRLNHKASLGVLKTADESIIKTDDAKAELLADVFEQSFSRCSSRSLPTVSPCFPAMNDNTWFHADEIYRLLSAWPPSFSDTPDHIPLIFIKKIAHIIANPLEQLFNLSLMRSEVPSRWKTSLVTPVLKKPPSISPCNYRPISITSIFARLFEKIIKKKIESHLEEHSIISHCQHGFQKGKSTVTAMLQTLNDWTTYLDENYHTDVVYLDFCKAFDKVPHDKLITKLKMINIHPRIISWIKEFLSSRTFMVRVNSALSSPRCVRSGVPQGGVLSPVLFNIYIYDLPDIVLSANVKCVAFADDIKIYRKISSTGNNDSLQKAIDLLSNWAKEWELPLSNEKTEVLHLGVKNRGHTYQVDGLAIQTVDQIKDLGFIITNNLSFEPHCDAVANKALNMIHRIFRALATNDSNVFIRAFKTYVKPLLEYGTVIFSPYKIKDIVKIERVQNSFTRKLWFRCNGIHYDNLPAPRKRNTYLGLRTLAWRRKKFDLFMLHKMFHGQTGLGIRSFCNVRPSITRGGSEKLVVNRATINCRTHFFANRASITYSALSRKKAIPINLHSFKKMIDTYSDL